METDMRTFGIPNLAVTAGLAAAMALGSAGSSVAAPAYGNVAMVRAATARNVIAVEEPRRSAPSGGALAPGILPHVASGTAPGGRPTLLFYPAFYGFFYGYFEAPYYGFYGLPPIWLPLVAILARPIIAVRPRVRSVRPHVHGLPPRIHAVRRVHAVKRRAYAGRSAYGGWFTLPPCAIIPRVSCAAAWFPH
jgi:hypothetical protein